MTNAQDRPSSLNRQLQEITSSAERKRLIEQYAEQASENPELIPTLLAELQPDGDEIINWAIIQALGRLHTQEPEIVTALIQILNQGRPPSRRFAVEILEQSGSGDSELIQTLVDLDQQQDDDDLRICIIQILGGIGGGSETACKRLIHIIFNSSSYVIRRLSLDALAQIDSGSSEAIEACLHIVQTKENHDIHYRAMMHLSRVAVGNPLVIKTFKAMIQTQGTDYWSQESRKIAAMGLQEVNRTLSSMEDIGRAFERGEGISYTDFQHHQEEKAAHINPENISIFLEMIDNSSTDDVAIAVQQLTIIGKGQPRVIDRFITLLPHYRNTHSYQLIATGLLKILTDVPKDLKDKVAIVITQELYSNEVEPIFNFILRKILVQINRAPLWRLWFSIEDVIMRGLRTMI